MLSTITVGTEDRRSSRVRFSRGNAPMRTSDGALHPRPKQPSHARRFHWVAALLVGAACSQGVGHDGTQLSHRVVESETEEVPLVSPVETTVAPGTLEPPELPDEPKTPEDATYPRVPRTGAPGTTKGTISCGTARCDASTHDCEWDVDKRQWACVPEGKGGQVSLHHANCDDASDCAVSEVCCIHTLQPTARFCMPRGAEECAEELCQEGGSPCPRGTTCDRALGARRLNDESGIEGVCRAPADRATCADNVRCPAEKPVCVLASKPSEPPTCEPETSELVLSVNASVFRCTRQADCKPEESCMFGARSQSAFCGRWQRGSFNALVCDPGGKVPRLPSQAELNRVCSGDKDCLKQLRCWPRVEFPWLGVLDVGPREANLDAH